ncbi:hypothetical protein CC78DRAFT_586789 [Lojkania enalia]|uniref:Uncharacterized protein n=1 Tax=Lojkania enalia TaxID=147567 RepID=A0A9P4MVA0_9PLEO|nr:hypothetical protein CC78DRAFT_586789 [Didymosphaeria enalia]
MRKSRSDSSGGPSSSPSGGFGLPCSPKAPFPPPPSVLIGGSSQPFLHPSPLLCLEASPALPLWNDVVASRHYASTPPNIP